MGFFKIFVITILLCVFSQSIEARSSYYNCKLRQAQSCKVFILIDLDSISANAEGLEQYKAISITTASKIRDGLDKESALKEASLCFKNNSHLNSFSELADNLLKPLKSYVENKNIVLIGLTNKSKHEQKLFLSNLKGSGLELFSTAVIKKDFAVSGRSYSASYDSGVFYLENSAFHDSIIKDLPFVLSRRPRTIIYIGNKIVEDSAVIKSLKKQNIKLVILDKKQIIRSLQCISDRNKAIHNNIVAKNEICKIAGSKALKVVSVIGSVITSFAGLALIILSYSLM